MPISISKLFRHTAWALLVAASPAVAQQSPPGPGKPNHPRETNRDKRQPQTSQRGTDSLPLVVKLSPTQVNQIVAAQEHAKGQKEAPVARETDGYGAGLFFVGIGQAILFIWQLALIRKANDAARSSADAAGRSAALAERALTSTERAFVFPRDVRLNRRLSKADGMVWWVFEIEWENSGNSPTRNLRIWDGGHIGPPLPADYDFAAWAMGPKSALIGPGAGGFAGGLAPIQAGDLHKVYAGEWELYLWGRARYHDIFDGTREHITTFCYKILVLDDPAAASSTDATVSFLKFFHGQHNCADEDCPD